MAWSGYPHELSGGELQRVALGFLCGARIARVLNPNTRYLIANAITLDLSGN
ncbi:MAG: hypothetical protein F6K30_14980 [Cyanothece sp. SIO2G6]|nr:hypothetical protein [Cyanothece sp. SIO2G6]